MVGRWTCFIENGVLNSMACERPRQLGIRIGIEHHILTMLNSRLLIPNCRGRSHADLYWSIAVMLRFGTCPTGIRVTSFIALISMTDTAFD